MTKISTSSTKSKKSPTSITTNTGNTTTNSTTRDTGTVTNETKVPEWALSGLQGQYNQAQQDAQGSRNFYNSILGGQNKAADLWANREFQRMLQLATGAPGFTEQGAAAQGIASAEAMAAVQAAMMDRMFQASQGLNGLSRQTVPFLELAGQWAPQVQTRDLTTTTSGTTNTNNRQESWVDDPYAGLSGVKSTSNNTATASPNSDYIGPMTYAPSFGAAVIHPAYKAFLAGKPLTTVPKG